MPESPFEASYGSSVILYLEPFLNTYLGEYMNILTVSDVPTGPLRDLVAHIRSEKLSPFTVCSPFDSESCKFVVSRYPRKKPSMNCVDGFMMAKDIPSVLSYLQTHGYKVDTDMTKIIQRSGVSVGDVCGNSNRKMICLFSYTPMKI
jgi:hypothetical protein